MVKLNGPLLSLNAGGSIAKELTYSQRRSGSQVRFQKKQADVTTTDRTTQRGYFIEAYGKWNTLNANEQAQWNTFNKG